LLFEYYLHQKKLKDHNLRDGTTFIQQINPPFNDIDGLIISASQYHVDKFDRVLFGTFGITFPEQLYKAVPKRQAEYLAGRVVAMNCLSVISLQSFQILSDKSRCPLWPELVKGSISHTNSFAASVITTDSKISGVGIDIEHFILPETIREIRKSIVDEREWQLLGEIAEDHNEIPFTTVFSAKESIFKAIFPSVKQFFDFSAVRLIAVDTDICLLEFELVETLSSDYKRGRKFTTHYFFASDSVYTLCIV
jgi:4'-phosphopantetheinyl transferase EntD